MAAENFDRALGLDAEGAGSMRPRRMAAENASSHRLALNWISRVQ